MRDNLVRERTIFIKNYLKFVFEGINMQKLSKVLLTVTAIFTLSGCSQQNNSQSQKNL